MKVKRLDVGRMDAPVKTPQGFLKAPAHLTRAGVFTYYNADGSPRREYRPKSEVLKADSLATLISAPVTDRHPPEPVTSENREKYDRGNVGDNIVRDGGKVAATIYVKDGKLISAIERGDMQELSCGYVCDLDPTPGVVPEGEPDAGEHYDAVQVGIAYNHVAVVPVGRAGSSVRLHLDAAGNAVFPRFDDHQENKMKIEVIDGVEYTVGSDAHKAACTRRDEAVKAAQAEREAVKARADKAEADLKAAQKELADMPAKLEAQAKARGDLLDAARKVLGAEAKFDGKTDAEIKLEVAQAANREMKLDEKLAGKTDAEKAAYIGALFDMAVAGGRQDEGAEELAKLRSDAVGDPKKQTVERIDYDAAVKANREWSENAWKTPAGQKAS